MAEVVFNGSAGRLEGRYHQSSPKATTPIALILHPHPQFGGTMHNKVVYALCRTFSEQGYNTLRFNFRGVGRSEGKYDQGEGELNDATCALDWLQSTTPNAKKCVIAGFSFGAWIALQLLMRRPEIHHFIAVSPPADRYDFSFLAPCPVPGLILQGQKDDIVPFCYVEKLIEKLKQQKGTEVRYTLLPEADHFFKNNLSQLCVYVEEYLKYLSAPSLNTLHHLKIREGG